jgi:hypothetical protein
MNSAQSRWRWMAASLLAAGVYSVQLFSPEVPAAIGQQGYAMSSDQPYANQADAGQFDLGQCDAGQCDVGQCPCGQQCDVGGCDSSNCASGCCEPCCGAQCHRTGVFGEFLYLHATGVDMVHAQQQNGIGGAGTVPFGKVGAADPHYEPAFRVGGALALSNVSSVTASYTHFESDSVSTVDAPVIPGGGGAVGSLVQHPGAALTASPGPVTGFYGIDYQLADGAYRRLLFGDGAGWVNYSVGGRYAHLDQNFLQTGDFGGGNAGVINTRTDIQFDGGGALFGLDGEHFIGRRGFSVFGGLNVSPIFGQFSSAYQLHNITTDTALAIAEWKDDRVVTLLEYQAGLAWTSPCYKWRLSAGYVAQFWYNAVSTADFVNAVQTNNYTHSGDSRVADTISFDGLAARVERRF